MGIEELREELETVEIDASDLRYRELNRKIKDAVRRGYKRIILKNVNGQRYIADGLVANVLIEIYGTPGNDLGMFMNGPTIIVYGNAQDGVGNTMSGGRIVIHGDARDILGYAMRNGKIFVKGDVGYRVGIHMKEYKELHPRIVVGGTARDFLGEYMAGGTLLVLNLKDANDPVGFYTATGIHGGRIYIRGDVDPDLLGIGAKIDQMRDEDWRIVRELTEEFCRYFGHDPEDILRDSYFTKIVPRSHRPYGKMYGLEKAEGEPVTEG